LKKGNFRVTNNIRRLRFDNNEMTQKQLAEKTGVTRQTIVAIENAKYAPSLELAFLIAHAFNTPLQEVFFYGPGATATDQEPAPTSAATCDSNAT
jgi:putative transcriptional regulator